MFDKNILALQFSERKFFLTCESNILNNTQNRPISQTAAKNDGSTTAAFMLFLMGTHAIINEEQIK